MSNHSSEVIMAATENSTAETNGGGTKKANGKNYENSASETDLGSVASSLNTSADEDEEDEDISDHEVQFKSKKSRRTAAPASSSTTRSTRASRRNSSPVTLSPAPAVRTLSPAPTIEKRRGRGRPRKFDSLNSSAPTSNSPTPTASTTSSTTAPKRPRLVSSNSNNSQKSSSNTTNCLLCSEVTEDLGRHLALTHFKAKLLKVLPVQPPFKCPKCSLAFSKQDGGQDGLIVHYGSYHNLNDKYLEDDLKLKPTNNGHKQQTPRRSRRTTTTTTSAISNATGEPNSPSSGMCPSPDSRVECKLCGTKVSNLNDHAFEEHFKEDVLASLPRSLPFYCPRCSNRYDTLEGLVKHFVKDHEILETYLAKGLAKTDNDLNSNSSSNSKWTSSSDLFTPPSAWLVDKPRSWDEFCQQITENLVLKDGRTPKAMEDRLIKCVCGKSLRLNMRWNWRYLVQKPTFTNGKVIVKGHWYGCSEVERVGSFVEDWIVNQELAKKIQKSEKENLANKNLDKGCDSPTMKRVRRSSPASGGSRGSPSRTTRGQVGQPLYHDGNGEDSDDDSDQESEPGESEETPREQRLVIRQHVTDLLALRVPGETFTQDAPCYQISHEGSMMCYSCKSMPLADKRANLDFNLDDNEIACAFYQFRKLKAAKFGGSLSVAGFLDPQRDPVGSQISIWKDSISDPAFNDVEKAKFILGLIGDQFCDMVSAERKCVSMHFEANHLAENRTIVWKPAVKRVREVCDVCKTSIFNYHWICGRCGLFFCLDCYKFRKGGLIKGQDQVVGDARDEYNWPYCINGEGHFIRKLNLAQVIPKNELLELAHKLHHLRHQFGLNQFCHKSEQFAEAYSLHKMKEINRDQFQTNTSPTLMTGKNSMTYKCRMCPNTAFKWQSCLYKHLLISHFSEKIKSIMPKIPTKDSKWLCPMENCDYEAKLKHILMIHVGITHKLLLKWVDEEAEANDGKSMIVLSKSTEQVSHATSNQHTSIRPSTSSGHSLGASSSTKQPQTQPQITTDKAFQCPMCPLLISHPLKRNHLVKHFYAQLSAEVATKSSASEAPFECHLCRHVAVDRISLVKHLGVIHKLVDKYLPTEAARNALASSDEIAAANKNGIVESPKSDDKYSKIAECRLCDRPQFFKHNGDLHRHLSMSHFAQRIWKEHLEPQNQRPFHCNLCEYTNNSNVQLIIHVGMVHKMAIKYHNEVLNFKENKQKNHLSGVSAAAAAGGIGNHSSNNNNSAYEAARAISTGAISKSKPNIISNNSNPKSIGRSDLSHNSLSGLTNMAPLRPPPKPSVVNKDKAAKCPVCDQLLAFPALLFHVAQHHFSQFLANFKVPVEAPFSCPICPHFAEDYGAILRHFLIYHKQMEKLTERLKNPELPVIEPKVECPPYLNQDFSQKGPFQCLLCDDIRPIGPSSYDFHKHLCEHHFRERLLQSIPQSDLKDESSEGVATAVTASGATSAAANVDAPRKFKCPVPNCGYELPQRWVMAKHLGLKHQVAKQWYAQICNQQQGSQNQNDLGLQHQQPLIRPQDVSNDDMIDESNDSLDESFDELEALNQISSCHDQDDNLQYFPSTTPNNMASGPHQTPTTMASDDYELPAMSPNTQSNETNFDCKICSNTFRGLGEYLKHISKIHFKHKLLEMVPNTSPYKCPWEGCEIVKKDRFTISLHYGITHKVALKLMQDMPQEALKEPIEVACQLCQQKFTAQRYLYTHLSDGHFQAELDHELPSNSPFKCPKCPYLGNDIRALRVHFGVRHKAVLNHLANKLGVTLQKLKQDIKKTNINNKKSSTSTNNKRPAIVNSGSNNSTASVQKLVKTQLSKSQQPQQQPQQQAPSTSSTVSFSCRFCNLKFKSESDYTKHIVMHLKHVLNSQLPNAEPFQCPKCNLVTNQQSNLLLHYGSQHPEVVKEILSGDVSQLDIDMSFVRPQSHQQIENNQKQVMEDKSFPKCRLCNYRYFTRLDLCRHFVDYHLRARLANCIDPHQTNCPACSLTYEKKQSRLRHFIWSHQDLERLVVQDHQVRLSEFMPSLRDLEIVKIKQAGSDLENFKDITDLAALPVHNHIDVKLTSPCCELCGEEFKTGIARDKSRHLISHFKEEILKDLPAIRPFKCPKCSYVGRDLTDLTTHYGLNHKIVFKAMQRELGGQWTLDDLEQNDCKVCSQVFLNNRLLNEHYCSQHFYAKLSEGLPNQPPYQCPSCAFNSKTHLALVRHVGNKHKVIKKILFEQGYEKPGQYAQGHTAAHQAQAQALRRSSGASQDSNPGYYQNNPNHNQYTNNHQPQQWQQEYQQYPSTPSFGSSPVASGFASPPPHQMQAPSPQMSLPQQQQQMQQQHHLPSHQHLSSPPQQHQHMMSPPPSQQQQHLTSPPQSQLPNQQQQAITSSHQQLAQQQHQNQLPTSHQQHMGPQQQQPLNLQQQQMASSQPPAPQQQHVPQQQQQLYNQKGETKGKSDQVPVACPICNSTLLNGTHFQRHAADKHFFERLKADLPNAVPPFNCSFCTSNFKDLKLLIRHYGVTHKMVIKYLNERAGIMNSFDESIIKQYETTESNRENCPLCKSTFNGRYMLLRHLCDCHFRERLCQVLPTSASGSTSETTYKCPHPQCTHESKDKGGFVRHYGLVHKVVQGWLKEMGITGFDDGEKKQKIEFTGGSSSTTSQPQQQEKQQQLFQPPSGPQQYQHQYAAEPQTVPPQPAVQVPPQQPQPDYTGQQQQYYSSPPPTATGSSSFNSQFSPPPQPQSAPAAARSYSNHLTSPSSQASPQNLSNEYISPQNTPYQQYDYYNTNNALQQQQPAPTVPENTQPLDYSSNGYFNQPQQPQMRVGYGQQPPPPPQAQPLTPQTPNPPTPQTPQPMTPSSHEAVTPQPMTPQDQQLLSPGGYTNYQPVQQQQQQQYPPTQYASRPVTLQPQESSAQPQPKPVNNKANHGGPPSDEYIEAPASGLVGPWAIQCLYCNNISKNKSDFYRHLSERHFKAELAKELPSKAPYKCPIQGCQYESKDNSVSPLIKHYGIVHKSVQKFLQGQMAGRWVHNDKASKGQQQQQHQQEQQQQQQVMINGAATADETTMSNLALKVKCPFCDLMFAARYTFHQHLCDKHFKDVLAEHVPSQPPFLCPVQGCQYLAKDSRQSLIRHYGMVHKVIVDLLKRQAPEYVDDVFNEEPQQQQHQDQQQHLNHQMQPQQVVPQQQQQQQPQPQYYTPAPEQHPAAYQQHQEYYHHHQDPATYTQPPYDVHQGLHVNVGHQPPQDLRFEPQIDGTFDPTHYSDQSSLDGARSMPTTPVKQEQGLTATSGPPDSATGLLASNTISPQQPPHTPKPRGGPKICEICGKHFEGKNRAMLKVQHMAHHFKDKLFADLQDKSPPFKCPVDGCQYQTKHKPDWARHYGSVHQLIAKYLNEYFETHEPFAMTTTASASTSASSTPFPEFKTEPNFEIKSEPGLNDTSNSEDQMIPTTTGGGPSIGNGNNSSGCSVSGPDMEQNNIDEKTYSAFLPKSELSQIINTAMDQQSQPTRNFGVITINTPNPNDPTDLSNNTHHQSSSEIDNAIANNQATLNNDLDNLDNFDQEEHHLEPQQCFICPNGPWFKNEKDLNEHLTNQHIEFVQELKQPRLEVLDDLGEVLNDLDIAPDHQNSTLASPSVNTNNPNSLQSEISVLSNLNNKAAGINRSTGRPCELCGFEPKTKNKSRERQDHLAMKHYRERIQADLTASTNFSCPLCSYVGKDKQTIYRHYTGKHKVVEQYLSEDIANGRVVTLAQKQAAAEASNMTVAPISASIESSEATPSMMNTLPSFEATTMELKNPSAGLDLSLHGLVDPDTGTKLNLHEFLDGTEATGGGPASVSSNSVIHPGNLSSDRIMQVDGNMLATTSNMIMQVDGADDDLEDLDDDYSESESSRSNTPSRNGTPTMGGRVPQMESRCPICDIPTKVHKTYHLATKHFKERLIATLPARKPFKCPDCEEYESKTRINLWTHYLGKHAYHRKWTEEVLLQRRKNNNLAAEMLPKETTASTKDSKITATSSSEKTTSPLIPLQASMQAAIHASMQTPIKSTATVNGKTNSPILPRTMSSTLRPAMSAQGVPQTLTSSNHLDQKHQRVPPHQQALQPQMPTASSNRLQGLLKAASNSEFLSNTDQIKVEELDFKKETEIHQKKGIAPGSFEFEDIKSLDSFKKEVSQELEVKHVNMHGIRGIELSQLDGHNLIKNFGDVLDKADIKNNVVDNSTEKQQIMPITPTTIPKAGRPQKQSDSVEFWCDLCQKLIKFVAKWNHYASIHFESKLRKLLPSSEPFLCVYCNHIGKDLMKLTNHFLNRHDVLEEWIREEFDAMEDKFITKSNNDLLEIPLEAEADFEEILPDDDDDNYNVENAPMNGQQQHTSTTQNQHTDLRTMISQLYPDVLMADTEQPQKKKRKISKSIRDRGLDAIKDLIEPPSPDLNKYNNRFTQSIPKNREPIPVRIMTSTVASKMWPQVPHHWFCKGKLLMLTDPSHPNNLELFQGQWIRGQPIVVANVHKKLNMNLWRPEAFNREFGHAKCDIVNTKTGKMIPNVPLKLFWDGFDNLHKRMTDEQGMPMSLKLKDWPTDNDLAKFLPRRFEDLMKCLPLPEYTQRTGRRNLAGFMPDFFVRPDLGPKMYIAYGNALYPNTGTTNLHIDMSDACNLLVYVGIPQDGIRIDHIREGLKSTEEADCDPLYRTRVREVTPEIGAIWHIFHPRDADKIRDMLNKVALEKGQRLEPQTDPIHDQTVYLDTKLRKRLYEEYGVVGYSIPQCEGDVVFIPAGAPHQVRNIHNCIKIALDFVSPENLEWCFYQTEEFRHLSETHSNHEDKLQIKSILYHGVKECVNLLEKQQSNYQK